MYTEKGPRRSNLKGWIFFGFMVSREKLKLLSWHIQSIKIIPKKFRNEQKNNCKVNKKVEKENLETFLNR